MQLNIQSPFKTLNKAYLKEKVSRNNVELFKVELTALFNKAATGHSEDTLKDFITEFLRNTWYNTNHSITINKERKDLSIHTGKTAADPVSVIAEIKKTGSTEMIADGKLNVKAFHELVLYYLQERITIGNNEIKYLLASDVNNWILIDANEFDKKIYGHTKIKRLYETYVNDKKDNPFFYNELKKIIEETDDTITCTQFNLNCFKKYVTNADKADDEKLIPLYKILSPTHLLKLSFANDSNSLDKNFYTELLHLIGLEEIKDGSKKLIQRKKERSEASLLENAIIKLRDKESLREVPDVTKFGFTNEEQYYNIALELCITWVNRILFLKLLEAQLYNYHQKNDGYLFLNDAFIHDFDELNNLFLQVLAEKPENRRERLKNKFSKVPYLNSSLFERTQLERKTIDISALDNNLPLPLDKNTVLKDNTKRKQGSLPTLSYLFTFLNSYDFASEGKAEIQEENKNLINASVLGLIFEKINGYKDGSFFTPGFITMYMCRETLRRAVVQKFNDANKWACKTFEELQEAFEYADKEKRQQANNIINSITICDPAVGSGHFLVSALNELISIKHDLKILQYHHNGQRINHKEYKVEIENDELIIQDIETEDFFKYTLNQKRNIKPELQYLQETLFHEKETLIENCLFGVDINANSVKICRLRLWIELLKNAYYTKETNYTQLETLPNIDINIKQGNSLISRFALDEDLSGTLQKSKWTIDSYKLAVQTYRNAQSKEEKRQMEDLIETIKRDFKTTVSWNDPINKKLSKLRGELALLQRTDLFSADAKKKLKANKELETLSTAINKLDKEKDDIQSSAIYKEAFEWRFEFPEVLDSEGKFLGFDVVIGNPPYVRQEELSEIKDFLSNRFEVFSSTADLLVYFIEKGLSLLKEKGDFNFIVANKFMRAGFGKPLRKWIQQFQLKTLIDFGDLPVFDEATTYPLIISIKKQSPFNTFTAANINELDKINFEKYFVENCFQIKQNSLHEIGWNLAPENTNNLIQKLKSKGLPLNKYINGNNYYGIKTGLNEAFVIDTATKERLINEDKNSAKLIKPFLIGKDIKRYTAPEVKQWLIAIPKGFTIKRNLPPTDSNYLNEPTPRYGNMPFDEAWYWLKNNYPAIAKHLFPYKEKSEARSDKGDYWWELRACDYYEEFDKTKIIYPNICKQPEFIWDENGYYTNQKCFIITDTSKYLLAILNSKLTFYLFKQILPKLRGDFYEPSYVYFKDFPIVDASEKQKMEFELVVDKILSAKKENPKADTTAWEKEIDELVYALYGLTEEEKKMVEG
jgi:adenine-specific DNA-methyltransferase